MQEPFTLQFMTTYRKYLEVIDIFPHEGDYVHYKNATIELRTDSMLNNSYYYDKIVLTDKDGNALTYNRRNTKTSKAGDPFGFIRIPVASTMTPGEEYTLTIANEMCDTAGIHLPEAIVHKFTAVDAGEEKPDATVIEDFEDASKFSIVDVSVNTEATLSASSDKLFGSKSLQIKINDPLSLELGFTSTSFNDVTINGNEELSLHVNGDMSNLYLKMRLMSTDDSQEIAYIDFGKIDFHGWRYITGKGQLNPNKTYRIVMIETDSDEDDPIWSATIKLDNLLKGQKSWVLGDVNGDGVVTAADITELYNYLLNNDDSHIVNGDMNGDGNITAADITAVYDVMLGASNAAPTIASAPEHATHSSVKVGPIPSSDYIMASAPGYIQGVELYDMSGNLMVRNGGNYINVENIKDGHYILKVYTGNDVTSHNVAVMH